MAYRLWHFFPIIAVVLLLLPGNAAIAAEAKLNVSIEAGNFDRVNTPVTVFVAVPKSCADVKTVALGDAAGNKIIGQLTKPNLLAPAYDAGPGKVVRQLDLILPKLAKGKTLKLGGDLLAEQPSDAEVPAGSLAWKHEKDKYAELSAGDRPVMRYMCRPLDKSSPEARFATGKVFHHLYDPSGKRFVTNGPFGLFPHHRGLFFGYTKCSYEGCPQANTWWCHDGEFQSHDGTAGEESGPVLGRHRVNIISKCACNQNAVQFAAFTAATLGYDFYPGGDSGFGSLEVPDIALADIDIIVDVKARFTIFVAHAFLDLIGD